MLLKELTLIQSNYSADTRTFLDLIDTLDRLGIGSEFSLDDIVEDSEAEEQFAENVLNDLININLLDKVKSFKCRCNQLFEENDFVDNNECDSCFAEVDTKQYQWKYVTSYEKGSLIVKEKKKIITREEGLIYENGMNLWNSDLDIGSILIEQNNLGDETIRSMYQNLTEFGIAVLRISNLEVSEAVFKDIATNLGPLEIVQNDYEGEIKEIKPNLNGPQGSGNVLGDLGYHVDGTQSEEIPPLLIFQFENVSKGGGNSFFLDLGRVLSDIVVAHGSSEIISLANKFAGTFNKKNMTYEGPILKYYDKPKEHSGFRIRLDEVLELNEVSKSSFEMIRNYIQTKKYDFNFKPREGDIVVFDNRRLVHARDGIIGKWQRSHNRGWIKELSGTAKKEINLGIRSTSTLLSLINQQNDED
jgi:alpha-ketoglutarate-dependent taurine dioxygenase